MAENRSQIPLVINGCSTINNNKKKESPVYYRLTSSTSKTNLPGYQQHWPLDDAHMDLQRAVQFVQAQEQQEMITAELGLDVDDDQGSVFPSPDDIGNNAAHYHHSHLTVSIPPTSFGSFVPSVMRSTISPSSHDQQSGQRMFRRAASFSPNALPCSPPVPIPQQSHHRRRRSRPSGNSNQNEEEEEEDDGEEHALPPHDGGIEYSKTQCEARLWDEYWNYKLSLESRESFEQSNNSNNTASEMNGVRKHHSLSSMASTADSVRDVESMQSDDDAGDESHHVFAMDDL